MLIICLCLLRQDFPMKLWLSWNSLSRPGWSQTQDILLPLLPEFFLKDVPLYTWLWWTHLNLSSSVKSLFFTKHYILRYWSKDFTDTAQSVKGTIPYATVSDHCEWQRGTPAMTIGKAVNVSEPQGIPFQNGLTQWQGKCLPPGWPWGLIQTLPCKGQCRDDLDKCHVSVSTWAWIQLSRRY